MSTALRAAVHALIFVLAAFVFFLGLGVGLAANATAGSLLWIAAAAIALLNVVWIVRRKA